MSFRSSRLLGALASLCLAVTLTAPLSGCGGGGGSSPTPETPPPVTPSTPTGQISGQVLSATDASPVANARISAAGATTTTDAQGRFTLTALAPATSVVLRIQADGHLDAVLPLPVTANQTTNVTQRLVSAGGAQTFSAAAPGTISVANTQASVDLPANGFVLDGTTTAATGDLKARLSVIDPARNPAAMPGRYVTTTGRAMESFGAINVDLRDAAGNKLNLKAGSTATIRIPLATRSVAPPTTVPLFYLDETTGQWKQEGTATLKTTADGSYYEGTVSHFTSWNADVEMDTIYVNGCVNDSAGKAVSWAIVQSSGVDYSGMDYALTDTEGKFRVAIRKNSLAELLATYIDRSSAVVPVGPSATGITLPTCLVLADAAAPRLRGVLPERTVVAGQQVVYRCPVSGSALRYQWQRNDTDIAGETYETLSFNARPADDGATYRCMAQNGQGQVTSEPTTLHVKPATAPVVLEPPLDVSALVGGNATFTPLISGSAPLTYQWQRNGVDIAGATSPSYTTPTLTLAENGTRYRLVVRNALGSATSAEATLTVTTNVLAAPTITTQPTAATTTAGQTATFVVVATGNPTPTFQWLKNGADIAGATSAVYTTVALTTADSGASYSVRVTNSQGNVTSAAVVLTVQAGGNSGSDSDQANLMRLLGTSGIWLQAVSAPLEVSDEQGKVLSSAAVCQTGNVSTTLDGVAPTVGQALPANGVLSTRFTDCVSDGTRYNGRAIAEYRFTSLGMPTNGTATVSMTGLRMADTSTDYTVDGNADVKLNGLVDSNGYVQTATFTPAAGASITNNLQALRATLTGGSFSFTSTVRPSDQQLIESHFSYVEFTFTVGSTPYKAAGSMALQFNGPNGSLSGGNGEIRLFSNDTTVGRLYFANGTLQIEVNGKVQPFAAPSGRLSR